MTKPTATVLPWTLPLRISPEFCDDYERIALALRDQTIERYAQYLRAPHDTDFFHPQAWKPIKRRESVCIYLSRERNPRSAFARPLDPRIASPSALRGAMWTPMVRLCGVGTTVGSLDDAMYGAAAPTELAMARKSLSIQDEFCQHRTLRDIKLPTAQDPFAYVGLKWSARAPYIVSLIKARDVVYVEATGFHHVRLPDGRLERVGYIVYHSVELPEVPPLTMQGLLRFKFSSCDVYRQASPGVVEVMTCVAVHPAGSLPFHVTAFQAAEAMISVCNVTESAMKKKLVWMQAARIHGGGPRVAPESEVPSLRPQLQARTRPSVLPTAYPRRQRPVCGQCAHALAPLRSRVQCEICSVRACPKCITSRKLVLGEDLGTLAYKAVAICKACMSTAVHMDNAAALAVYEFVQPFDPLRSRADPSESKFTVSQRSQRQCLAFAKPPPATLSAPATVGLATEEEEEETLLSAYDELSDASISPTHFAFEAAQQRQRLWSQINQLCLQAEQTYRMAVLQTQAIQMQQ